MKPYAEILPRPFFVLAPMDDVTDTVFRRLIAEIAPADLYMTEFTNVDGLQSPGRLALLKRLRFEPSEQPLIAQIWGKNPENYYKTAQQIFDGSLAAEARELRQGLDVDVEQGAGEKRRESYMAYDDRAPQPATKLNATSSGRVLSSAQKQGRTVPSFAGIDINMGCPDKAVLKNGCGGAMIDNPALATEIIQAVKEGSAGRVPISVKTRLGRGAYKPDWLEFLLQQKLNMLSIHLRTVKEMSKVPAHWDLMPEIKAMRDSLSPETLLVGNGDVMSRAHGEELVKKNGMDGVMVGRGIFADPYALADPSPWPDLSPVEKIELYLRHIELFENTWQHSERPVVTLNKFCKIYINDFPGAKDYRTELMACRTVGELKEKLNSIIKDIHVA